MWIQRGSDNVVRAGLTPKHKDVELLLRMLTYEFGPPCIVEPTDICDGVREFDTKQYDDFTVFDVNLCESMAVPARVYSEDGPCIMLVHTGAGQIVVDGESTDVKRGQVVRTFL